MFKYIYSIYYEYLIILNITILNEFIYYLLDILLCAMLNKYIC